MNSRERMLAVFNHERPDRVPTDIWAVPEVWDNLRAHFGADADLHELLHIDGTAGVGPKYIGPALPMVGADERIDFWGIRRKKINYGCGDYYELSHHPLAAARTIDDLEAYPWPSAEWFDYSELRAAAEQVREKQVVQCGYMAPSTYHTYLRGLETALTDPLTDPAFTRHLLGRLCDFFYDHHRRMFEACDGLIDVAQVTDDYGMQTGPLISPATFREFYKPHLKRFCDLTHEFGARAFHHDDGAIRDFLPDLIEIGIDILNPIQWRCPGMAMAGLKRDFGERLVFHGAIDNQQTLPFGSPQDVRAEVRLAIDTLASDGTGYILAPCHN
ncbi:hypothetical protein LCGC14_1230360, partial [marine sediment metagenome]